MSTYQAQRKKEYTEKLRAILKELPSFCGFYFRSKETQTSVLTRYGYALDLRNFFSFLVSEVDGFKGKKLPSLTLSDLDAVSALDIEMYLESITLYVSNEVERQNGEQAKKRKLSAIRSFFKYYYRQEMIKNNPASLVDSPRIHEKAIIRLDANEVANLLDAAEGGQGLSERQKKSHQATKLRDVAILTLFLGTGIRISELVGIDLGDINFDSNQFSIIRKGGDQEVLSFGDEVRSALLDYIERRKDIIPCEGSENALFLSIQRKRITVRAVEYLVKRYAMIATPQKKITPHKLRSTYGTMLYNESNDIYLVADVLGHKDVNTTKRHYAAMSEEKRRTAAKMVKLRDETD
ncbi:MAG: tyrosine-type recombinase/integrase [Clostridia bacterium]|nr:tyrosine-type recombinase/integrase [Clostridia bacterium]